ncbi:MAG: PIN domain-containing protein [Betaproteobacteria bacterium]|nr:PIN domain-containing protein [Betaproteobacteria bacterium]
MCRDTLSPALSRQGVLDGHDSHELPFQCLSLPIRWVRETPELLVRAGEIKARHRLSLADAWIAACASLAGATLVHKDPEFVAIGLPQEALPWEEGRS